PHTAALHSFPTRRSSDLDGAHHIAARHTALLAHGHEVSEITRCLPEPPPHLVQPRQAGTGGGLPHGALALLGAQLNEVRGRLGQDRKSTRLNSSHDQISY